MDTLHLVLANDDPVQSRTFFQDEDSVSFSPFAILACTGAPVIASIRLGRGEALTSLHSDRAAQGASLGRSGEDIRGRPTLNLSGVGSERGGTEQSKRDENVLDHVCDVGWRITNCFRFSLL